MTKCTKGFFFIVLCSILSSCSAINNLFINRYELKGKLIELEGLPPGCGFIAFALHVKFEIIEFSDEEYNRDTIGVVLTCAGDYSEDFLQNGSIYTMHLEDENPARFSWAIAGEKGLSEYGYEDYLWITYRTLEKEE